MKKPAKKPAPNPEFRPFNEGHTTSRGAPRYGLDEVIARDVTSVHFEAMSDREFWCGIYLRDGREVHVNISGGRRSVLAMIAAIV